MNRATNIRPKQRKLAQAYISGKPYKEIAKDVGMDVENPSQSVHNRLKDKGTQAAIAELITESNVIRALTTDKILYHIQKLALDETLKPKEREGYLRMLAEYKALLKQVNLNENVTSSDALVEEAQKALDTLMSDSNKSVYVKPGNETDQNTVLDKPEEQAGSGESSQAEQA